MVLNSAPPIIITLVLLKVFEEVDAANAVQEINAIIIAVSIKIFFKIIISPNFLQLILQQISRAVNCTKFFDCAILRGEVIFMKLVITVVGKDRVGIIAAVTKILADNEVNILSINQNILNGFFNMILFAEANESKIRLVDLQAALKAQGESIGVEIKTQHQDIFDAMHKI